MLPLVYYCYDAYCGWCYGNSTVIKQLQNEYDGKVDFEVLSGGMVISDSPKPISVTANYILNAYKTVEAYTGVKFGQDYLWHIKNPEESDWFPNSEKPAIALSIFKELHPTKQVQFAVDLQYSLYAEGRDLCDNEAYKHLLEKYEIDAEDFFTKLKSDLYKEKAYNEFALCKQLQVDGFPTTYIQMPDNKFYAIARGFTPYENLKENLDRVLKG
jgi:putative protein-disulfide isomerase